MPTEALKLVTINNTILNCILVFLPKYLSALHFQDHSAQKYRRTVP